MRDFSVLEQLLERVQRQERRLAEVRRIEAAWHEVTAVGPAMLDLMARWVAAQVTAQGLNGALVGVSGGVDSTLGALVVQRAMGDKGLGLVIPDSASDPADEADAVKLCKLINLPCKVVPMGPGVDQLLQDMSTSRKDDTRRDTGNMVSRLRIAIQYYEAAAGRYLVVGSGDTDEAHVGYSSKGLAADVHPVTGLHKEEVRQLVLETLVPLDAAFARYMAQRPASPGFWAGQRAEEQLGLSYQRIGPAVDVLAAHCPAGEVVVYPNDEAALVADLEASGVSVEDFMAVVDMCYRFRDTAWHSPGLYRPVRLRPLVAEVRR